VHAGSRSLLVSHWYVASDAAERLTTGMFAELAREPRSGGRRRCGRSMVALMDGRGGAAHAGHPAAWAPFVVVGEGGAVTAGR
jgi:CHAT domain-containing protein